ncbi:MAG: RNA polymerase sigma factor SigZ [Pseudomonadota bacterium]
MTAYFLCLNDVVGHEEVMGRKTLHKTRLPVASDNSSLWERVDKKVKVGAPLVTTEEVWIELSDRLKRFFMQRVPSEDVADDLLQEAFFRIHKSLTTLDDVERLTSWVFQIARNLVVDYYRSKEAPAPSVELEQLLDENTGPRVEEDNLNELVMGWLPPTIAGLPDPYREAVELYELKRLPQQEIADQLGISLSGAKSRVQRGRGLLKDALSKCCAFERDRRGNVIGVERHQNGESACDTACCD